MEISFLRLGKLDKLAKSYPLLPTYLNRPTSAAPLAVFRICFGILMLISLIRFWANGWIEKLYLAPTFHFSYWGFEWVKPLGIYTYGLFIIAMLASLAITFGYRYRWAILIFFLSFTYIELMDKTTYLNHYYFVSVMSFLLLFIPANATFSLDARRRGYEQQVPRWSIDAIKLLLTIVYFYAGLAKLNSDWLVAHEPLYTWLPTRYDIPLFGWMLEKRWAPMLFSWGGALYDLTIPFLLWYNHTRPLAFLAVLGFHIMTAMLFPIGMFPYIMIVATLIFFSPAVHEKILAAIRTLFNALVPKAPPVTDIGSTIRSTATIPDPVRPTTKLSPHPYPTRTYIPYVLTLFFLFQILFPFRYLCYPDELFWTEEGYRFSWRVMLMEKAGYANFKLVDRQSGKWFYINNGDFITAFQEKEMAKQPDFMVEYAHYLADHFRSQGWDPAIYVESYVALNGRSSRLYIDPEVDLTQVADTWKHKDWILPFEDQIWGF